MRCLKPSREQIEKPKDVVIRSRIRFLSDPVAAVDDTSFDAYDLTVEKLGIPCRATDLVAVSSSQREDFCVGRPKGSRRGGCDLVCMLGCVIIST